MGTLGVGGLWGEGALYRYYMILTVGSDVMS